VLAVSGEECTADVVGGKRWPQNVCSDWSWSHMRPLFSHGDSMDI
jgi:hypothetical protein